MGPTWSDGRGHVRIAKWPGARAAALSLTYDSALVDSPEDREVQALSRSAGVPIDYEFVAQFYLEHADKADAARALAGDGHVFFGHGFRHEDHDLLGYDGALESFRRTREVMADFGLTPIAFAYPQGAGRRTTTRRALSDAGFLSGRLHDARMDPVIAPGRLLAPADWYALPTAVAQDYAFENCGYCVNDSTELSAILDRAIDASGWIIVTYHSIGRPENWGYYSLDSFREDIKQIRARDVWLGSMSEVTLYLRERSKVRLEVDREEGADRKTSALLLRISDGLPNEPFAVPLTLVVSGLCEWDGRRLDLVRDDSVARQIQFDCAGTLLELPPDEARYRVRPSRRLTAASGKAGGPPNDSGS